MCAFIRGQYGMRDEGYANVPKLQHSSITEYSVLVMCLILYMQFIPSPTDSVSHCFHPWTASTGHVEHLLEAKIFNGSQIEAGR